VKRFRKQASVVSEIKWWRSEKGNKKCLQRLSIDELTAYTGAKRVGREQSFTGIS